MSEEIRADILDRAAQGTLRHAIFNDYGRRWSEEEDATIAALADLHNERAVDLLALITCESLEPFKGAVFFHGQHVYRELISRLDAPAAALLKVVDALFHAADGDTAAAEPVDAFEKWCALKPDRPAELLSLVDQDDPVAKRFLAIALVTGAAVNRRYFLERTYDFLKSEDEQHQRGAIHALRQINLRTAADWKRLLSAWESLLSADPGDAIRAALLTAIAYKLKDVPDGRRQQLAALGIITAKSHGDQLLHWAARSLAFNLVHMPDELVEAILEALLSVSSSHGATIDTLDHALRKLLMQGQTARARTFVAHLLRRDSDPIGMEHFDSLRHQLFQTTSQDLENWVVSWLLDGDFTLCRAMGDHLFSPSSDEYTLNIDFARFDLRTCDYPYLARKVIGTFFSKPVLTTSLLVSLLRTAPKEAADDVINLLIDPIVISFPAGTAKVLELIAADATDPAAVHAQRALEAASKYLEDLHSIGTVPELHPSERERQMERQRHTDAMTEAFREAQKKSILATITSVVMLYGNRSVSQIETPTAAPHRIETPLASFGHSIELPRVDIVDPVGLEETLIHFRQEQRPP